METKYVRVPFEVELAKRIQNKECEGRIVTRDEVGVRIICWDMQCNYDVQKIVALLAQDAKEILLIYNSNGKYLGDAVSNCDLMLEIPEYMTFKDEDVLSNQEGNFIFILNGEGEFKTSLYACLKGSRLLFGGAVSTNKIEGYRRATEKEKQRLIDALKASKEPNAKECLKKLGVEVKPECEFKPFDKVLVRSSEEEWRADIFSHVSKNGKFSCVGYDWSQCIPYNEETAHLLGTTQNYE